MNSNRLRNMIRSTLLTLETFLLCISGMLTLAAQQPSQPSGAIPVKASQLKIGDPIKFEDKLDVSITFAPDQRRFAYYRREGGSGGGTVVIKDASRDVLQTV